MSLCWAAQIRRSGKRGARLILTFTPAGIERFFEATLERLDDPAAPLTGNVDEVAARYAAAGPLYGLTFV